MSKQGLKQLADRKRKNASKAYLTLTNNFTSKLLSEEMVEKNWNRFIFDANDSEFHKNFSTIYKQPRVKAHLKPIIRNNWQIFERAIYGGLEEHRYLALIYEQITQESQMLGQFAELRAKYEDQMFTGIYQKAISTLDEIESLTGQSLWLIRNRIFSYSMAHDIERAQAYIEEVKAHTADRFLIFIVNCFLYLATDPILHLGGTIRSTVRELEKAGLEYWADLLSLVFVPMPLMRQCKKLHCAMTVQSLPLVDQFVLGISLASHNAAISEKSGSLSKEINSRLIDACAKINSKIITRGNQINEIVASFEREGSSAFLESHSVIGRSPPNSLTLINLFAKASEIASIVPANVNSPIQQIQSALQHLYGLSGAPEESIGEIKSIAIRFHSFFQAPLIQLAACKAMPHHFEASERSYIAKRGRIQCGESTPWGDALEKSEDPILSHKYLTNFEDLPEERSVKRQIRELSAIGCEEDEMFRLLRCYENIAGLRRDYFELASAIYIKCGLNEKLIELCARHISDNPHCYTAFPLRHLIYYIEKNRLSSLESAVVVHYYVRHVDDDKEYLLNETYEDFLINQELDRPSELIDRSVTPSQELKILLRDISTIETMDFLSCFASSDDLRSERIILLDYLREIDAIEPDQHQIESEEIVGQAIVDAGATEFSVHKIEVNDSAIKRKLTDEISSLLRFYKSAVEDRDDRLLSVTGDDILEDVSALRSIVAGDKYTTVLKMFSTVQDAFLFDDKHGLEKNLSAEIRHGFFANLIRSRIEDKRLLTEIDENNVYKNNVYWLEANSFLSESILLELDEHLGWFSASLNSLITEAEEWMKVTRNSDERNRAFNFAVYVDDIRRLRRSADMADNAEEFIEQCFGLLWEKTETALVTMQDRINSDFRYRVDQLFEKLTDNLNATRGSAAMADLMEAVLQAKNFIREDIATVGNWFKRGGSFSSRSRSLPDVVDIAIECFERVRGTHFQPSKKVETILTPISLEGRHIKSFIVALFNLFENGLRHSGFGKNTDVEISGESDIRGWKIVVSNTVSDDVANELSLGGLERARGRMKGPGTDKFIRTEGGTGLSKVLNQLNSISDALDMSINLFDKKFEARITYVY